ncbi:radical SAM protein [bacterium]|nr:radical SAM protein [bacterium]
MSEESVTVPKQSPQPLHVFGPVPSRRFGQSLGINTIPPKTCSYSCVYCQLGRTSHLTVHREPHCDPGELLGDVRSTLRKLAEKGEQVDYLTFVPDGEPTLDSRLGDQLDLLRPTGIPLAVITNASLLSDGDVRQDLARADRVSVKLDAVRYETWRRIDRPHGDLRFEDVLDGVLQFAREFKGELDTETMLVKGMNDSPDDLKPLAAFLEWLKPRRSYISIPIRPPAVGGVLPPGEDVLVRAYEILSGSVEQVELLIGFEGTTFASTGDAEADLLAITSVHPMRSDQVEAFLEKAGSGWETVEWMVRQEKLQEVAFGDHRFFIRRFRAR